MNAMRFVLRLGCLVLVLLTAGLAQEKETAKEAMKRPSRSVSNTPLRVQLLFVEMEGERKISSVSYLMHLLSYQEGDPRLPDNTSRIRVGLKVPIVAQGKEGQIQYQDVGTNIDATAQKLADGRFLLALDVERQAVYSLGGLGGVPGGVPGRGAAESPAQALGSASAPVIQAFRASVGLFVSDGQTIQTVVATDPVSGRVLRLDVTLTVVK